MLLKKKILNYEKKEVDLDISRKQALVISGPLGLVKKNLKGQDINYVKEKTIHLGSKVSYTNFVSIIKNGINGVVNGYYVELKLEGLGFKYLMLKGKIMFRLGHSHYIELLVPKMIKIVGFRNRLVVFGLDLGSLNQFCFILRNLRKKDVYKGKGIAEASKVHVLKVGKQR